MRLLYFEEVEKIADKYKIPLIETKEINFYDDALLFAQKADFSVVLRVDAPDVFHKTEKGLIINEIRNSQELEKGYKKLQGKIGKEKKWKILIQKRGKGVELFFGAKKDKTFGAVTMFGLGGILVEVLKDISFSVPPLTEKESLEAIKSIKGNKILNGYRGFPPVNIKKLAKIFSQFSNICLKEESIQQIDFNPVFAYGDKILVADPKIYVK